MNVEIWSDIVCPWCYIGKRRFESALSQFEHRDDVQIVWRSFELDPQAQNRYPGTLNDLLAQKYGMSASKASAMNAQVAATAAADGLDYRLEEAKPGNTFDAHRLLHLAAERGLQGAVKERLLKAYFSEGLAVGDAAALLPVVVEAGLDPHEVTAVLASDRYAAEVRADEQRAAAFGIRGVPFVVVDERYGVSGAQAPEAFLDVLQQAYVASRPLTMVGSATDTAVCEDGSCAVPAAR